MVVTKKTGKPAGKELERRRVVRVHPDNTAEFSDHNPDGI